MYSKNYDIGKKIRQLRKSKGWTQEQLAEKLDIDCKHLSRIEMGYHMPTYPVIQKLARVFDFDLRTFDDLPLDEIPQPDKITQKSMQILDSASTDDEKKYYLEALKLAQKGIKLGQYVSL